MESPEFLVLIALFGAFVNFYAWKHKYYTSPSFHEPSHINVSFWSLVGVFAIYLGTTLVLSTFIGIFFRGSFITKPVLMINWTQLLTTTLSIVLLFLFSRFAISENSLLKIWKDTSYSHAKPIWKDIQIGLATWILAFPLVVLVGEFSDLFIYYVFGVENYEQVAVVYLKMTREHPSMLVIALSVILIIAPCVEEYLFRGVLQNWLRKHLGPKAAILLASFGFALFHMASSQGWGNISLVLSLFVFACFLGFVYEKQRSLFASIALHMAFNAISALRILLWTEQ